MPWLTCKWCVAPIVGAVNRVPAGKLARGLQPVCGRCHESLTVASGPVTVTDSNFTEQVERSPLPVLLDLWAPWCGPCRMVAPVIEELAKEMAGRLRVGKLNVDENPMTAQRFAVQGIPALLFLRDGREIDRMVGAHPKAAIARRIEEILAKASFEY